jgi:Polyketide cyclase / dehydrase and lipid transport
VSRIDIQCQADINGPADQIFDLILDFGGQGRWLPRSSAFRGTTQISSDPVALGTTYREPGPLGVRNGEVTELERPVKVTFHQPMTMRLRAGVIDVTLRYTLTPGSGPGPTHVTRVVTLGIPGSLGLLQPVIVRSFRTESTRTLMALKAYVDRMPATPR